jgi:hypothetical protein
MKRFIHDVNKLKKNRKYNGYIDEETNEVVYVEANETIFYVYILYLNGVPIYAGKTENIKNRILNHKRVRVFDSYQIVSECYNNIAANFIEKFLISYLKSMYPELLNVNSCSDMGLSKIIFI